MNKSLAHQPEDLNLSSSLPSTAVSVEEKQSPATSSPCKAATSSPCKESVSRVLSLQDEINAESARDDDFEENSSNKTIQEEMHDLLKDDDTVTEDASNDSFVSDGQVEEHHMPQMVKIVEF